MPKTYIHLMRASACIRIVVVSVVHSLPPWVSRRLRSRYERLAVSFPSATTTSLLVRHPRTTLPEAPPLACSRGCRLAPSVSVPQCRGHHCNPAAPLCTPSEDCRMANALGDRRSTRHSITGGFPPPGIRSGGNRHFESLNLSHSQWPQRPGVRQRPRRGRGHIGQAIWCSPGVPSPLTFSHTAQAATVQERSWRRAHTRGSSPGGRGAEGGGEVQSSPGVVRGTARRLADRVAIAGGKHEERRGRRGGERVR